MVNISKNGIITIHKGDTAILPLYINLGTELNPEIYSLQVGDVVYFVIAEANQDFNHAIVKKRFTSDNFDFENHMLNIKIKSADTNCLLPGTYYYSVKLVRCPELIKENGIWFRDDEEVDTLITRKKFIVLE